jgi:polar amino acid transport system substrate-binding protein
MIHLNKKAICAALVALVFPAMMRAADITPASIKAKGMLTVATSSGAFPFEMTDKHGQFIGFDIDLARAIAKDLGVRIEFQNYPFSGLIPALVSNKVDFAAACVTATEKRKEVLDFSSSYYLSGQALLVNSGTPNIKQWQDLDKDGMVIGVSLGTTADLVATQSFKKATIKRYDGNALARMDVLNGKANALVNEPPAVGIFQKLHPKETYAVLKPFTTEEICLAVPKGNPELVKYLNKFLKKYMKSEEFKKGYHYWFETLDWYTLVPPK